MDLKTLCTMNTPADIPTKHRAAIRYVIPRQFPHGNETVYARLRGELEDMYRKGYCLIELEMENMLPLLAGSDETAENWRKLFHFIYKSANEIGLRVDLRVCFDGFGMLYGGGADNPYRRCEWMFAAEAETARHGILSAGDTFHAELQSPADAGSLFSVRKVWYTRDDRGRVLLDSEEISLEGLTIHQEAREEAASAALPGMPFPMAPRTVYDTTITYEGPEMELGEDTTVVLLIKTAGDKTDFYSREGVQSCIQVLESCIDSEFSALLKRNGGYITSDGGDGNQYVSDRGWSTELASWIQSHCGYDFNSLMPVLYGEFLLPGDGKERLYHDWQEAMASLFCNFNEAIETWAMKSFGVHYRAQIGYSTNHDTQMVVQSLGQIDTETLWCCNEPDSYISMTAAKNMTRKPGVVSSEMGAMSGNFRNRWTQLVLLINNCFASGVNHMIYHTGSFPCSTNDIWPGFTVFGTTFQDWGSTMLQYDEAPLLNAYVGRAQAMLQNGTAKRDFLIYIHDYLDRYEVDKSVLRSGYTYDIVSPSLLSLPAMQNVKNGAVDPEGGEYKALVIDRLWDSIYMPMAAAETIRRYAEEGVPVLFIGKPEDLNSLCTAGYGEKSLDSQLRSIFRDLEAAGMLTFIESEQEIPAALTSLNVRPRIRKESSAILSYSRAMEDGSLGTFFYNYDSRFTQGGHGYCDSSYTGEETKQLFPGFSSIMLSALPDMEPEDAESGRVTQEIAIAGSGTPHVLDLWTGEVTVPAYIEEGGCVKFSLSLALGEGCMVMLGEKAADISKKHFTESITPEQWMLTVERWEPENPIETTGPEAVATKKTGMPPIELSELKPWDKIESLGDKVSGVGAYETEFPAPVCDGMTLKIDWSYDVVRVIVNGRELPVNQASRTANIPGALLKEMNTLKVLSYSDYYNETWNCGAYLGSKNPMSHGPFVEAEFIPRHYGITGKVTLTAFAAT